jgi:hypothetical protein
VAEEYHGCIASATGTSYDPPTGLTATTWYRRLAKDGTCNTSYTASTGVWQTTVRAQFAAGAIPTTGETICYNGDPALITATTNASGGDNSISYQWQSQGVAFETSVGYSDISGATDANYDPPASLTTTTTYRRLAKDGTCNTAWSASTGTWTVTVRNQFTAGAIPTTGETICYNGNPALITATTAASGGDNVISYQWQYRTVTFDTPAGWADISGATGGNYDPPASLTATTSYRRLAKDGTCNTSWNASTGTWTVTVYANFTVGSVSADQNICENSTPALLNSVDPTGGNTPYTYQWQSSTTLPIEESPVGFTNISGATNTTYQPGALTQTTYYRMSQGSASSCGSGYTNIITVTVEPTPVSGVVTKDQNVTNICEGTDVSATIAAGSGGNGTDVHEYRTKTGGTWSGWLAYVSGDSISTSGITDVEIQAYRTATYCSNSTPNTVSWIIDPTTVGGAVTGGTQVCLGSNSTELTLTGHTGTVQYWQYSTDGIVWSDTAVTSTTFTAEDVAVETWYRAVVKSGTCIVDTSESTQITVFSDYHISGYVKYENNPKTPLDGLKITLKKDGTPVGSPVTTGTNGYYDFGGLTNGSYSLEVATAHPSGNWQTWGGVNNTDALIVLNHINNSVPLTVNPPVVRITASVKLPHPAIDNTDYIAIRQASKYPATGYNYFSIPKWVFSGTTTTTGLTGINLNCANVTRDIRGLCAGDVNGTYVPVSGNKSETQQVASLQLENRGTLPITREIVFPVRVETHGSASLPMEIGAITLFLDYDESLIEITDVTMPFKNDKKPYFLTNDGVLNIGWHSTEPVQVDANGTLMLIHARLISETTGNDQNQAMPVRFTLDKNPLSELADGEGNVLYDMKLSVADASLDGIAANWDNGAIGNVSIYPNPASKLLNVEVVLTSDGNVQFDLVNMQGTTVMKSATGPRYAGWYKESLDVSRVAPGVYFLKVSAGNSPVVMKVIVGTN